MGISTISKGDVEGEVYADGIVSIPNGDKHDFKSGMKYRIKTELPGFNPQWG